MFQHKKATSCTGIPTLKPFRPTSIYNRYSSQDTLHELLTETKTQRRKPLKSQSFYNDNSLPLPTVCFFSKEALVDEYATTLDTLMYVSPQSRSSRDKLHLFVGILHSLFTVTDDLNFGNDDDDGDGYGEEDDTDELDTDTDTDTKDKEEDNIEDGDNDDITIQAEWVETPSFSIIGMNTMKVITLDESINDLALAIIVSSQFSDVVIGHYIQLLATTILNRQKKSSSVKELGDQITTLIQHWFNPFH